MQLWSTNNNFFNFIPIIKHLLIKRVQNKISKIKETTVGINIMGWLILNIWITNINLLHF